MKYTVVWGFNGSREICFTDNCSMKGRILAIRHAMEAGADFIEIYNQ